MAAQVNNCLPHPYTNNIKAPSPITVLLGPEGEASPFFTNYHRHLLIRQLKTIYRLSWTDASQKIVVNEEKKRNIAICNTVKVNLTFQSPYMFPLRRLKLVACKFAHTKQEQLSVSVTFRSNIWCFLSLSATSGAITWHSYQLHPAFSKRNSTQQLLVILLGQLISLNCVVGKVILNIRTYLPQNVSAYGVSTETVAQNDTARVQNNRAECGSLNTTCVMNMRRLSRQKYKPMKTGGQSELVT